MATTSIFETLGAACEAAIETAHAAGLLLAEPEDVAFAQVYMGGMRYGEKRNLFPIDLATVKGNAARRKLRVSISRFGVEDGENLMGRYECIAYVL